MLTNSATLSNQLAQHDTNICLKSVILRPETVTLVWLLHLTTRCQAAHGRTHQKHKSITKALTFSMTNVHSLSSNSSAWGSWKTECGDSFDGIKKTERQSSLNSLSIKACYNVFCSRDIWKQQLHRSNSTLLIITEKKKQDQNSPFLSQRNWCPSVCLSLKLLTIISNTLFSNWSVLSSFHSWTKFIGQLNMHIWRYSSSVVLELSRPADFMVDGTQMKHSWTHEWQTGPLQWTPGDVVVHDTD